MKKFNILFSLAVILVLAGCSAEQDVAGIADPTEYPTVTITADGDYSTISEGDVLSFTLETDAFFNQDIDFAFIIGEATGLSDSDFEVTDATFYAYSSTATMTVEIFDDGYPEMGETLDFTIDSSGDPSYNFQINPNSGSLSFSNTVVNVNSEDAADVSVNWEDGADDWDVYIVDGDANYYDGAETGGHPELMNLSDTEDDGTYYVVAYDWDVAAEVTEFEVAIGSPDGSVSIQSATIDVTAENNSIDGSYIVGKITKSGSTYTLVAGNAL